MLFGYLSAKPVINLLLLLVKQYIVMCKSRDVRNEVSIDALRSIILQHFLAEKHAANVNMTLDQFHEKWRGVLAEGGCLDIEKIM